MAADCGHRFGVRVLVAVAMGAGRIGRVICRPGDLEGPQLLADMTGWPVVLFDVRPGLEPIRLGWVLPLVSPVPAHPDTLWS